GVELACIYKISSKGDSPYLVINLLLTEGGFNPSKCMTIEEVLAYLIQSEYKLGKDHFLPIENYAEYNQTLKGAEHAQILGGAGLGIFYDEAREKLVLDLPLEMIDKKTKLVPVVYDRLYPN
ncbi:unnamed protein product, partial [marine sediment metagenome]